MFFVFWVAQIWSVAVRARWPIRVAVVHINVDVDGAVKEGVNHTQQRQHMVSESGGIQTKRQKIFSSRKRIELKNIER